MSRGRTDAQMRIELLQARAALERAELRAVVGELKDSTRGLRRWSALLTGSGAGGLARPLELLRTLLALRSNPLVAAALAALLARRRLRRALVLAAVAGVAWLALSRRPEQRRPN
jgi:hypothetical protein